MRCKHQQAVDLRFVDGRAALEGFRGREVHKERLRVKVARDFR